MSDAQDEGKPAGFRVSDRRSFAGGEEPAKPDVVNADEQVVGELPGVDFHTFILSLGSSALLHLGELDGPDGQEAQTDLPMAKQTIDMIAMLQEKTRGNLTPPEDRLIESLLYDLRLRFVERNKK